ncbi:unnamed protein product, partial [Lepidochelys olivacea]
RNRTLHSWSTSRSINAWYGVFIKLGYSVGESHCRILCAIEEKARDCMLCQSVRNAPQWAPLHPWDWPENLWQRIHMDFAGPLEGSMFLVVVDAHSKWPEVSIMQSTTAESTIQKLRGLFSRFGLPEQLLSDNRPQFVSQAFQNVMKANGVHHITSAPHHPSTNGLAERFVQTMKQALKSARGQLSIQKHLDTFLLSYRNTPHATTKASPAFLMIGRQLRTFFDLLKPSEPRQIVQRQQQEQFLCLLPVSICLLGRSSGPGSGSGFPKLSQPSSLFCSSGSFSELGTVPEKSQKTSRVDIPS